VAARVRLSKSFSLPDPARVARCRRAPEAGPRLLFFSGGSALAPLSRRLIAYTHNSIHLITPFDSGGSSAKLRWAFGMLAVGDLRNRLMALAEPSVSGNPDIVRLFGFRFPSGGRGELGRRLADMVQGEEPLVAAVPDPMRKIIRNHLRFFQEAMPPEFDLAGASVGNLVLAGGYLNQGRHIDPVIFLFSKLAEVRGTVRPVVSTDTHLAAELADGSLVVGQHLLTGREVPPPASPIRRLFTVSSLEPPARPVEVAVRSKIPELIGRAELICFPMGSFYTSLLANLLPAGVGAAVAAAECPKVYVPNPSRDPEQRGLPVEGAVGALLSRLAADCPAGAPVSRLMNLVLVDTAGGHYPEGLDAEAIRRQGVEVADLPLVSEASAPYVDPELLAEALVSLV
jgi:CofD-related protein of GAK system